MDLQYCRSTLERAGVALAPGLSSRELLAAEERFDFVFPPDLRALLESFLPVGKSCPAWRDLSNPELEQALRWPLDGIYFDIEHNTFWPAEWGQRPSDLRAAFNIARARVAAAPKLIPVFGHRYIPDRPSLAGNPVFSVYQTDIVYYGGNLEEYIRNEFPYYFGQTGFVASVRPREIEFWSWLVTLNE